MRRTRPRTKRICASLDARVQRVGSEVGVAFVEGGELDGGEGSAVEIGALEDEAGV